MCRYSRQGSMLPGGCYAPDFIVVVDPQYLNTRHLDNLLNSKPVCPGHCTDAVRKLDSSCCVQVMKLRNARFFL